MLNRQMLKTREDTVDAPICPTAYQRDLAHYLTVRTDFAAENDNVPPNARCVDDFLSVVESRD